MPDCNALIIGGGPAGLACAITLRKLGVQGIVVVEAGKRDFFAARDPVKSYSYRIDGHGFQWFDAMGLSEDLRAISAVNPDYLRLWGADGGFKEMKSPMGDAPHNRTAWVGREQLLEFLYLQLQQLQGSEVQFESCCTAVERAADGCIQCVVEHRTGSVVTKTSKFKSPIVIGSDGIHSIVRRTLAKWSPGCPKGAPFRPSRFDVHTVPVVSAGMIFKALHLKLPPTACPATSFGVIKGQHGRNMGLLPTTQTDGLRLCGCARFPTDPIWKLTTADELYQQLHRHFPQVDWEQALDRAQAERWVQAPGTTFPPAQYCEGLVYLDGRRHDKIPIREEIDSNGKVTFYEGIGCTGLAQESGVCLIGDALHCFPPDLGMGVNSALEDVWVLYTSLRAELALDDGCACDSCSAANSVSAANSASAANSPSAADSVSPADSTCASKLPTATGSTGKPTEKALPIHRWLRRYEASRQDDANAIAHLLPIGMPYQYSQPPDIQQYLW
jgi:2-polyprenyl-6-methoxyphenol hydroxylase-like FAD-dependent oxidoreductase